MMADKPIERQMPVRATGGIVSDIAVGRASVDTHRRLVAIHASSDLAGDMSRTVDQSLYIRQRLSNHRQCTLTYSNMDPRQSARSAREQDLS